MGVFDDLGLSNIGGGATGALAGFKTVILGLILIVVVGGVLVTILLWRRNKKKYNIPLIIITPRSDGRVVEINKGIGGYFKSRKIGGITSFRVKRKGIGAVEIPPPPSTFLSAPGRTLILAQKGVDDYEPVLPSSLNRVEIPSGKTLPILSLKAKNQEATAWAFDNEETAKKRFTFWSFWDKYQQIITLMVFVFILFLILYINWIGMKDVVAGLQQVADALSGKVTPTVTGG